MTDDESANTSRSEPWLHAPDDPPMAASIRWPDPDRGPWLITAHWEKVDGRPVVVGLDVRSFHDEDGLRIPIGDDLAEVTQRVLREISITQVRDNTREILVHNSEVVLFSTPPYVAAEHGEWAAERLDTLTAKGEPRKRRQPASEALLRQVAALYAHAAQSGDKAPVKYVEEQLRDAGEPRLSTVGSRVLVRQWVRRARERGYLTIPPTRTEGA